MHAIASNLHNLIEKREQMKSITFALVIQKKKINLHFYSHTLDWLYLTGWVLQSSGCLANETPDEKALIGYAQISISSD